MHYTDNANSWKRIGMLCRLYWPGLKLGFFISILLPMVCVFLSAAITRLTGHATDWIFRWPISILLYISPIMLTKRDYRDVAAQLPVTAAEKLGFLLLTFWIIVPAAICLSSLIGEWISIAIFGDKVIEMLDLYEEQAMMVLDNPGFNSIAMNTILSVTSVWAMVAVVLYYVVTTKKNRALSAVGSMIVVSLASALFVGIIGGIIGVIAGFKGAADGISDAAIQESIRQMTIYILIFTWILIMAIGTIFVVKLYKRLRNCGF